MIAWCRTFVETVNWIILIYFLGLHMAYILLLCLAAVEIRGYLRRLRYAGYDLIFADPRTPAIAMLMPAFNEEINIAMSVRGVLNLNYPRFEVIVINDGSTDRTLEELRKAFDLVRTEVSVSAEIPSRKIRATYRSLSDPRLIVLDKENGGKADSLNAGINAARTPYICAVDADIILEEDALLRVVRPVVEAPGQVVAVGGIVRVANGCRIAHGRVAEPALPREMLPMFQVVEYLRAFLAGRSGFSSVNGLLIISGAFGLFARDAAVAVGGYRTDTVGEDMELVCSIHEYLRKRGRDYRIVFIGDPVCWTEVPSTLKILSRQRRRWQRGLMESLGLHRDMLFRPNFGVLGFFSYPFFLLFEAWGPLVELLGYTSVMLSWGLGWLSRDFAILFLTVSILLGMAITLSSILLDELSFARRTGWLGLARLFLYGVIENVGFRQLNSFYRVWGLWEYLRKKEGWGVMERRGLGSG